MLTESFLSRLSQVQIALRRPARGGSGGLRKSRALGNSVEFSDFREYAPGDDLRRIDWNAYARFDRLFLKLFMEEQEAQLHLILDASASMEVPGANKWTVACDLAQTLAYLATRCGDRITLWVLGDETRQTRLGTGRGAYLRGARSIQEASAGGKVLLCDRVARLPIPKGRGMAVLITDLMSEDGYLGALQSLCYRGWETALLQVLSPGELEPDLEGAVELFGSEGGRLELVAGRESLLAYQRALADLLHEAQTECRKLGACYALLRSDLDFEGSILRELSRAGLIG